MNQETLVQRILRETITRFSELCPKDVEVAKALAGDLPELHFKDVEWITATLASAGTSTLPTDGAR